VDFCDVCDNLGIVYKDVEVGHPDFGKAFPCPVCWRGKERRQKYIRNMSRLESYEDKSFDTFNHALPWLEEHQQMSLKSIVDNVRHYAAHPDGWLVLHGGLGVGKTHLAAAVAHESVARSETTIFTTVPDLLDHLRSTFSPQSTTSYDQQFEQMRNVHLLVLDDLGTESSSEWAQEKLYQLIDHRYNNKLPTIITTNVTLTELEERIASRMLDIHLTQVIPMNFPDYRQGAGLEQHQAFSDIVDLSRYRDMTFSTVNYNVYKGVESLERAVRQLKEFATVPEGWRIILGEHGGGKTHLAAAVANHWMYQQPNQSAIMVRTADLLDFLRETFEPGSKTSLQKRFKEFQNAPLLLLDDFHLHSNLANWSREKLFQLVDYRYLMRLPTVFVIATRYTRGMEENHPEFMSRLSDRRLARWIVLETDDYRQHFKAR
jgi:DNA replication protein DnaC